MLVRGHEGKFEYNAEFHDCVQSEGTYFNGPWIMRTKTETQEKLHV